MANEVARSLRKRMTAQEVKLWVHLRSWRARGFHFRRQAPIADSIVDFACLKHLLVIEVDGGQHNFDAHADRDMHRDKRLAENGFRVLRFWNNEVDQNLEGVLTLIDHVLHDPPPGVLRTATLPLRGRDEDALSGAAMTKPLVVDFHAHFLEKDVLERSQGKTVLTGFGTRPSPTAGGSQRVATLDKMLLPQRQIDDMDRLGIDVDVITLSTVIGGTSWADARTEAELTKRCNDRAAEWCAAFPQRFVGSFVLPLQDMDLSMREFERATGALGLKVANLGASYGGLYLGHPRFHPLWEAVVRADVTVFIHPEGTKDLWFQDFGLWNSVGQPIEEAKVMSSIIYEGVFDKFPGVKIVMAHGGGYLPHYFGRLDRNVTNMPESARNIKAKPSDYLAAFYYDTCTYNASTIEALIRRVGVERLVMGSDYPVGDGDPIGSVKAVGTIGDAERPAVLGGTAAKILGLG